MYDKYFKDVSHLHSVDIYRVLDLFDVTDHALGHAIKKLLLAGVRTGNKTMFEDIMEAHDTLGRWMQMREEDLCTVNTTTVDGATPPKERTLTQDLEDVMIHPDALVGMEKMMMAYAEAFPTPLAKSSGPTSSSLQ